MHAGFYVMPQIALVFYKAGTERLSRRALLSTKENAVQTRTQRMFMSKLYSIVFSVFSVFSITRWHPYPYKRCLLGHQTGLWKPFSALGNFEGRLRTFRPQRYNKHGYYTSLGFLCGDDQVLNPFQKLFFSPRNFTHLRCAAESNTTSAFE